MTSVSISHAAVAQFDVEVVDALTGGLARLGIARERVQQMTAVSDLLAGVDRQLRRGETLPDGGLTADRECWPRLGTTAGAFAPGRVGAVRAVGVQRATVGGDQDHPEARSPQ